MSAWQRSVSISAVSTGVSLASSGGPTIAEYKEVAEEGGLLQTAEEEVLGYSKSSMSCLKKEDQYTSA
jgi:hypothetical protein